MFSKKFLNFLVFSMSRPSGNDTDENVSDSEVFRSSAEFTKVFESNDVKTRRTTVSGGSPSLKRPVVGSAENIYSSCNSSRPKSFYPHSKSQLADFLQSEFKKTPQNDSNENPGSNYSYSTYLSFSFSNLNIHIVFYFHIY